MLVAAVTTFLYKKIIKETNQPTSTKMPACESKNTQTVWIQYDMKYVHMCMHVCRYLSKRQHHWGGTTSSAKTRLDATIPSSSSYTRAHKLGCYKSFISNDRAYTNPPAPNTQKLRTEMGFPVSIFACSLFSPKSQHFFVLFFKWLCFLQ